AGVQRREVVQDRLPDLKLGRRVSHVRDWVAGAVLDGDARDGVPPRPIFCVVEARMVSGEGDELFHASLLLAFTRMARCPAPMLSTVSAGRTTTPVGFCRPLCQRGCPLQDSYPRTR